MKIRNAFALALFLAVLAAPILAQTPLSTRKILAKVNLVSNEILYADDISAAIAELEKVAKGQKMSSKDKLNLIMQKIDDILFRQFATRESIKVADSEITQRITEMKGQSATEELIQASMISQGILLDLKSYVREDIIFSRYVMAKKQDELKAASKYEVQEFIKAYDDMKFNLRRPDLLRFSMIFINLQGKSDADKKKAVDLMESISKQIKVNAERYDEFIVKGLVDPDAGYITATSGTIYKTQDSKKQNPAIYEAAFSLKEGQISEVVTDDTRVCIIRATEFIPERQLGLTDRIDTLPASGNAGYLQSISPSATVLDLVAYEVRSAKSEALSRKIKNEIFDEIRKKAGIKITLSALSPFLDQAEIDSLKAMKGQYNLSFE